MLADVELKQKKDALRNLIDATRQQRDALRQRSIANALKLIKRSTRFFYFLAGFQCFIAVFLLVPKFNIDISELEIIGSAALEAVVAWCIYRFHSRIGCAVLFVLFTLAFIEHFSFLSLVGVFNAIIAWRSISRYKALLSMPQEVNHSSNPPPSPPAAVSIADEPSPGDNSGG